MRAIIIIISVAALLIAAGIAAAGPGARLGLWDYGFGLAMIRQLALPALVAAGLAALSFLVSLVAARGVSALALLAAVAAGLAAYAPIEMRARFEENPFIHDITTDFVDPPQIIAAADAPRSNPPEYLGDEPAPRSELTVAQAQQEAFPDIAPVVVDLEAKAAAALARDVIDDMGMTLLADGPTQEGGWLVEAAQTSAWFGFVDDFVVRVRPAVSPSGEALGSVLDIRSKSRVGGSDLGANAARVREFSERARERAGR